MAGVCGTIQFSESCAQNLRRHYIKRATALVGYFSKEVSCHDESLVLVVVAQIDRPCHRAKLQSIAGGLTLASRLHNISGSRGRQCDRL